MSRIVDGASVDAVVDLLNRSSVTEEPNEEISGLTILSHGLQCAAILRRQHANDPELQLAGLLHDVGHLLVPGDEELHGWAAAEYLRPVFGERVAELVDGHVPAKRYLVTEDPAYWSGLSVGSRRTLEVQGGAMTVDEVAAFRLSPHLDEILDLRRADEAAKDPAAIVPTLEAWLPILERAAS